MPGCEARHSRRYRDSRADYRRLQEERIAAFRDDRADVESGAYPGPEHAVRIGDVEFEAFLARVT